MTILFAQASNSSANLLPAVIGFGGAVIGAVLAAFARYAVARKRTKNANERAIVQTYLKYRVEALNELQREIHDCKRTYERIVENTNTAQFTRDQYETIQDAFEDFESAYDRVKIVFEQDERSTDKLSTRLIAKCCECNSDSDTESNNPDDINKFYTTLIDINKELRELRDQPVDRDSAGTDIPEGNIVNLNGKYNFDKKYDNARNEITNRLGQPIDEFTI